MRILILTNLLPYPLDNGGKIKTYTTVKALADAGHQIDLVCFTETRETHLASENALLRDCSQIAQVYTKLTTSVHKRYMAGVAVRSLFSVFSFGLLKYISKEMRNLLYSLSKEKSYDCIYIDHLQMFVYQKQVKLYWPEAELILDEHNCEYMIMLRNAEKSSGFWKKAFLNLEAVKLKKFEAKALKKADKVIVLSTEDEAMLKEISSGTVSTTIIPIGMKAPEGEIKHSFEDLDIVNILFVGTLSWAPNHDGLIWYLKKVIPRMNEEYGNFKLTIVGKNPGDELRRMAGQYSNIEITGYVNSVVPYYRKCDFMVVPLFVGSGQRVKIIEAFSFGMPVISTAVGAEGLDCIDGENILIADNVEAFIDKSMLMKKGSLRNKLSENALKTFHKHYSLSAVSGKIQDVIESNGAR